MGDVNNKPFRSQFVQVTLEGLGLFKMALGTSAVVNIAPVCGLLQKVADECSLWRGKIWRRSMRIGTRRSNGRRERIPRLDMDEFQVSKSVAVGHLQGCRRSRPIDSLLMVALHLQEVRPQEQLRASINDRMAIGAKQNQVVVAVQLIAGAFGPSGTASCASHDVALLADDGSVALGGLIRRN